MFIIINSWSLCLWPKAARVPSSALTNSKCHRSRDSSCNLWYRRFLSSDQFVSLNNYCTDKNTTVMQQITGPVCQEATGHEKTTPQFWLRFVGLNSNSHFTTTTFNYSDINKHVYYMWLETNDIWADSQSGKHHDSSENTSFSWIILLQPLIAVGSNHIYLS